MSEEAWNKHHFNVLAKIDKGEEFPNLDQDSIRQLSDKGMITTRSMYRKKNGTCHFTIAGKRLFEQMSEKYGQAKS